MKLFKLYYFFLAILVLSMLLLQNTSCKKEYSFEGADTIATIPDTSIIPPVDTIKTFSECSLCNETDQLQLGKWSFKTGSSYICGSCTNSGFFDGNSRSAFTFFGPSACSADTGIVVSVFLPVVFDQNRYNITVTRTAFYYYDHNAPKDILDSGEPYIFTVTVQSYIYETGIATGTFGGTVINANGDTAVIRDGKFKVLL